MQDTVKLYSGQGEGGRVVNDQGADDVLVSLEEGGEEAAGIPWPSESEVGPEPALPQRELVPLLVDLKATTFMVLLGQWVMVEAARLTQDR